MFSEWKRRFQIQFNVVWTRHQLYSEKYVFQNCCGPVLCRLVLVIYSTETFMYRCNNYFSLFFSVDSSADLFVQTKHEANDFLSFRRRKRSTHSTDVIEECCGERCRTEELKEYC